MVSMHDIKRPIKWKLFKELDDASKNEYILYLVDTFDVTGGEIAEMLGCSVETIRRHIKMLPVSERFMAGRRMDRRKQSDWYNFLHGNQQTPAEPLEHAVAAPDPVEEAEKNVPAALPHSADEAMQHMDKLTLSFDGPISFHSIFEVLKKFVSEDSVAKLEVSCTQLTGPSQMAGVAVV